jgi:GT2 family glycosyltransferase
MENMKLAVVISVLNQHQLATTCIDFVKAYSSQDIDIVILDNASDPVFDYKLLDIKNLQYIKIIRLEKNIGVYPTLWEGLKYTDADIIAYFHSDLMLCEKRWDTRVIQLFKEREKLGLVGFVGSDEIDASGGRGLGTTSNFKGYEHKNSDVNGNKRSWKGSEGRLHGKVNEGFSLAAVVDGCAMIFRRTVLENIKQRDNFPPHHFYDRLLSCEVQEAGYEVGVLGIGCDHISGQSVNGSEAYEKMAQEWVGQHGLVKGYNLNWDSVLYKEAERQFLEEYRENKKFIPRKA